MKSNRALFFLGGGLAAFLLMACLCGTVLVTARALAPTPTPRPPLVLNTAVPTRHSLQVENASSQAICYLYLSYADDDSWGPDQLGSSRILYPGNSFTLTNIRSGVYDIKARTCDGEVVTRFGIRVYEDKIWTLYD